MKIRGLKGFEPSNQPTPEGYDGESVWIDGRPEGIESLEDPRLLHLHDSEFKKKFRDQALQPA